jgi:hypothetical protein
MAPADPGQKMMALFINRLIKNLEDVEREMPASEQEVVRKLLADNSVTLASVQRGDFGDTARRIAEEFPFQEEETTHSLQ